MMKKICTLLLLSIVFPALEACQFEPLYQQRNDWPCVNVVLEDASRFRSGADTDAGVVAAELALESRIEQAFPANKKAARCYMIKATSEIKKENLDVQPNGIVIRQRFLLKVTFSLYDASGAYLFTSSSRSVSSYNLLKGEYSNFVTEEKLKERLVETVARDIEVQLASFFSAKQSSKNPLLKGTA